MSVGLDVERLDRAPRDPMALARRRLAPAEVRDLEGERFWTWVCVGVCRVAKMYEAWAV